MNNFLRGCLLLLSFWLSLSSPAQIPSRPVPPRLVNDLAGLLDNTMSYKLEQDLVAFDDSTSNQICLVIVNDLQGMDILDLAFKIGEQWQVGQSGFDNGAVLLIKTKTTTGGEIAIATGYGLEAVLTDAVCKRIIEEDMLPLFRQERYYEGIQAGLERIMLLASGEFAYESTDQDLITAFGFFALFVFFILVFIVLLSKKNKGNNNDGGTNKGKFTLSDLAKAVLLSGMASGGRSRGGSFGGGTGGFGGFGGGRFGGGGAKGGW
ncbi:MAG: TPM domain-containing protein [Bacteroidales bacterium]|nr:TPM domain-containing protein [Bacteroidales bacterium]